MLGPLLFDKRGAIVKKQIITKKKFNSKKNFQKSLFRKNFFLLNMNLKNVVKQKDAQGSYYWQKKFQQEKIKIEGVAFIHVSTYCNPNQSLTKFLYTLMSMCYAIRWEQFFAEMSFCTALTRHLGMKTTF